MTRENDVNKNDVSIPFTRWRGRTKKRLSRRLWGWTTLLRQQRASAVKFKCHFCDDSDTQTQSSCVATLEDNKITHGRTLRYAPAQRRPWRRGLGAARTRDSPRRSRRRIAPIEGRRTALRTHRSEKGKQQHKFHTPHRRKTIFRIICTTSMQHSTLMFARPLLALATASCITAPTPCASIDVNGLCATRCWSR